ncbi:Transducin/WD40 repeat-like superfamily protein [Hibiscus syriacus]|uniref:Transducin/WD40 repeat-like superfamily protein n=1 Tax=Hibiscus syriacus TaxID=106335 RepID=A0A6A3CW50_HIBSY|nr:Transducin/WD40 repeat-like superfamily protein [Hibiscus syriacus]
MDENAFKLSLLKTAPRLASVRIFGQRLVPQTAEQVRVLTATNSPNGIQGLLQYFNLVEGCLTMIESHQKQHNFTYDWIVRTRVDGYWNAPLHPQNFVAGRYTVPSGSVYGGLNDRFGIGDFHTSKVALSRLSLISKLDSAGYRRLNSESAFKAQLTTLKYPTPCSPVCKGSCVADVMSSLDKRWSWTNWGNGMIELCDAHGGWEDQWETIFDRVAGKKLAATRRQVKDLTFEECVGEFREMKKKAVNWDAPAPEEICGRGLKMKQ